MLCFVSRADKVRVKAWQGFAQQIRPEKVEICGQTRKSPTLQKPYNTEIPLRLKRDKTAYRLLNTKNGGSFEKVYLVKLPVQ